MCRAPALLAGGFLMFVLPDLPYATIDILRTYPPIQLSYDQLVDHYTYSSDATFQQRFLVYNK